MSKERKVEVGSPKWARFEDWLSGEAGRAHDWVVVAQLDDVSGLTEKGFVEKRATLSYLARNRRETLKRAFQHVSWDLHYGTGPVYVEEADHGIACHEDLGDNAARIFVYLRNEIASYPAVWKFWPTFENYFDLRSDQTGDLVDPYSGEVIARIPCPASKGPVRVRTDYLQDYLAARKMVLVRQHDHRRHWPEPIEGVPERLGGTIPCLETWGCYSLWVVNSRERSFDRFSMLRAKDIVTPYERAGTVGRHRNRRTRIEDYPEFIAGKGLDGNEVKLKPNPDDVLHPAFFNPKVLKRYYDEPTRYTVGFSAPGMGGVSFLKEWSLTIGRNEEGLIVVWLGDLAKEGLPYDEIVHWRAHNVPPRGGMAKDFWNAQMECEPSNTPSLESRLRDCKYVITQGVQARGKRIYRTYDGPDKYIEKTLRIPLFDEHTEFRETILGLSKMFIEYLDTENFRQELPDRYKIDERGERLGPELLFSNWLEQVLRIDPVLAKALRVSLQNVKRVRSKTGAAHRYSDASYHDVIRRLGLSAPVSAKQLFCAVAEPLAKALEKLCKAIGVGNKLWWLRETGH
jgi:hypothetical protein